MRAIVYALSLRSRANQQLQTSAARDGTSSRDLKQAFNVKCPSGKHPLMFSGPSWALTCWTPSHTRAGDQEHDLKSLAWLSSSRWWAMELFIDVSQCQEHSRHADDHIGTTGSPSTASRSTQARHQAPSAYFLHCLAVSFSTVWQCTEKGLIHVQAKSASKAKSVNSQAAWMHALVTAKAFDVAGEEHD